MTDETGPHQDQPISTAGAAIETADAAMILVHGRGATADSILELAREFSAPGVAFVAPQAAGASWYPQSFLAPIDQNEPGLSSGLEVLTDLLADITQSGIPVERTVLLGFSQGACLASEFTARNATRYGGLVAFSGGLIGPDDTPRDYDGSLDGTPVFLGCSDRDPHIPLERVNETARILEALGGDVTKRIYEGLGHTVNRDEVDHAAAILNDVLPDE